eukprot:GHRR01008268.1.p1 GENE.GHRR01008268.1~~GHRR01008268.1.p1  ORF type:complete len:561 (+),score=192.91 GHRR01008268.1:81-1763(+)
MFAFAGPNSSTCLHCTSKLSSRRSVHVGCALSNVTVGLHPLQSALAGAPALPAISQMYAADAHNAIPAAARTSVAPGDNGPILGTDRSRSTSTSTSGSSSSWQEVILQKAMEPSQLIRLILKAKIKGDQHVANVSNTASGTPTSSNAVNAATAAAAASQAGVMPYKQLTMRPVLIKNQQQLQISLLDARQDTTKNYTHQQAAEQLQQLLQLPWQSATVHTLQQTVTVQITKKGRALMQQTAATAVPAQQAASAAGLSRQDLQLVQPDDAAIGLIQLQHDRMKALPISGSVADPFLQKIGVQTADGRIKANMQGKFTQINEFLKLLIHTGELEYMAKETTTAAVGQPAAAASPAPSAGSIATSASSNGGTGFDADSEFSSSGIFSNNGDKAVVHVLDCGCGSSHLTFGTFYYLRHVRGLPVQLTGIDTNRALMDRSNRYCQDLGIAQHAQFRTAAIKEYQPAAAPAVVLALHACDTATDQALALGIRSRARIIMSVPCCHKDLHRQQQQWQQQQRQQQEGRDSSTLDLFDPLLTHGILRQRMLDLLTDTFRAHLLRLCGYR